jgi:aspartyl-tRNA(Asn)/glutamyl-tRNA(Gln) amidotransferase subunit C
MFVTKKPDLLFLSAFMDHTTLEHLKKLCKMELSSDEEKEISEGLSKVLSYVEQLNEVDTHGVEPCRFVLRNMLKNKMRQDIVQDILPREKFLTNAPDQIGGMVRVPPVLKPS